MMLLSISTSKGRKAADKSMLAIGTTNSARSSQALAFAEYELARRRAKRHAVGAALRGRASTLLSMDELTEGMPAVGEHYAGLQQVPVHRIVGSMDRHRDFDADFNPKCEHTRSRWTRVANAHLHAAMLPPVQLIKIAGVYMVEDGNHRVSVARHFGVEYIDAEVTEYVTSSPLVLAGACDTLARQTRLARRAWTSAQMITRLLSKRGLKVAEIV
jgi:hypothetical protein